MDKNDKIFIILKLEYRKKTEENWQNSKYKLEGKKVGKKYKIGLFSSYCKIIYCLYKGLPCLHK